jgi:hypothetical protein
VRARAAAALVLLAAALFMARAAHGLRLGSPASPGPGFFPFWLSLALAAVSLAILAVELRSGAGRRPGWRWRPIVPVAVVLLLAAPALGLLGFLTTGFVFLTVLLRGLGSSWPATLTLAAATSLASHLVFAAWLQIRFPRGPFGF